MKLYLLQAVLLLSLLVLGRQAQAQAPGSTGPTPTTQADPTAVPLDGGASLLLAGSVGYALRKLRARKRPVA